MTEKTMNDDTRILKEGGAWVRLKPFGSRRAEVVEGTVHWPGDILRLPDTMDWIEGTQSQACQAEPGEDTALSPFDLEIVYDALTGWWYMPQSLGGGVLDRAVEENVRDSEEDERAVVLDDSCVRAILEALASKDEIVTREKRRKGAA